MNTGNSVLSDAHPIHEWHEALREKNFKPVESYRTSHDDRVNSYENSKGHQVLVANKPDGLHGHVSSKFSNETRSVSGPVALKHALNTMERK